MSSLNDKIIILQNHHSTLRGQYELGFLTRHSLMSSNSSGVKIGSPANIDKFRGLTGGFAQNRLRAGFDARAAYRSQNDNSFSNPKKIRLNHHNIKL
jgi:hypothetical protein